MTPLSLVVNTFIPFFITGIIGIGVLRYRNMEVVQVVEYIQHIIGPNLKPGLC
jgi:hypothetical protein